MEVPTGNQEEREGGGGRHGGEEREAGGGRHGGEERGEEATYQSS